MSKAEEMIKELRGEAMQQYSDREIADVIEEQVAEIDRLRVEREQWAIRCAQYRDSAHTLLASRKPEE